MVNFHKPALLALLALFACGDDGGGGADAAPDTPDASAADAMPQNLCTLIETSYPDQGMLTGTAMVELIDTDFPNDGNVYRVEMPLNEENPADVLILEVWEDGPPFDTGSAPFSVSLIADNADIITCSACAFIAADYTGPAMINFNVAYSGQLELSALDPTPGTGKVTGSLSNLKLHEVTVSQAGQEVVAGGCKSTLEKVQFDFSVAAQ